jgi:transposase
MEYKQAKTEYSETLRKQIALEVISGKITARRAQKVYSISGNSTVYNWVKWYKQYGCCGLNLTGQTRTALPPKKPKFEKPLKPEEPLASAQLIRQLEQQLEAERLLKEMYLRMIEIAEQEYKISIRKKTNTR